MAVPVIRTLHPGDEATLEAFLLPRMDSSMFLLGNLRAVGLEDNGERLQGVYTAAFDGDRITGVAAHYQAGNLLLQAPEHLTALWHAAVKASGRAVNGIVGPASQVFSVRDSLATPDTIFQMNSFEKLYSLELDHLAVPPMLTAGEVAGRRLTAADMGLMTQWRVKYSIEALGATETEALWTRCRQHSERSLRDGTGWVLEAAGKPASVSHFNTTIDEAVQVGGVYTPPALRGQGFARAVVAQSLLDARQKGASRGILFTEDNNIAADRAYTALGFEAVGDYALVLFQDASSMSQRDRKDGAHDSVRNN